MKLIIDLPEEDFGWNGILNICRCSFERLIQIVSEGTPLEDQEPCEDAISRKDIGLTDLEILMCNGDYKEALRMLLEKIEKAPSVQPKQRTGRWITSDDALCRPICNNCGAHPWKGYIPTVEEATEVFKHCPNCGAKME